MFCADLRYRVGTIAAGMNENQSGMVARCLMDCGHVPLLGHRRCRAVTQYQCIANVISARHRHTSHYTIYITVALVIHL